MQFFPFRKKDPSQKKPLIAATPEVHPADPHSTNYARMMFLLEVEPRLRKASTLVEFFEILEEGTLKKIPLVHNNESIETEKVTEAIAGYLNKLDGRVPSDGEELFFDTFPMGEVSGIGKAFKDTINRLVTQEAQTIAEKRVQNDETRRAFSRTKSGEGVEGEDIDADTTQPGETIPSSDIPTTTSTPRVPKVIDSFSLDDFAPLVEERVGVSLPPSTFLADFPPLHEGEKPLRPHHADIPIQDHEKIGAEVRPHAAVGQEEVAPGVFVEAPFIDLSDIPRHTDRGPAHFSLNELPKDDTTASRDVRAAESIRDAVASFSDLDIPERTVAGTTREMIQRSLGSTIEDIEPIHTPKTLRPKRKNTTNLQGALTTLENLGGKVTDFIEEGAEQITTSLNVWRSRFSNGFNRLITKKPTKPASKEVSPEEQVFDIHPKKIESILSTTGPSTAVESPRKKVSPEEQVFDIHPKKIESILSTTGPSLAAEVEKNQSLERSRKALEALTSVNKRTDSILRNALETTASVAKWVLKNVELSGEKFNNLPKSVKYGTAIAIAGLGASGAPFVVPALSLATAFRVASGAGLYATLHKALELKYAKEEKAGRKVHVLRKQIMGAGAITVSAFAGYAIGQYLSSLLPTDGIAHITGHEISHVDAPASASVPDVPASVLDVPHSEVAAQLAGAQGVITAPVHEMLHVVTDGENLWNIVKDHLMQADTFTKLSEQAQNLEISKYLAAVQDANIFPNIDTVHPGDVIDFSQFDKNISVDILKHVNPFAH